MIGGSGYPFSIFLIKRPKIGGGVPRPTKAAVWLLEPPDGTRLRKARGPVSRLQNDSLGRVALRIESVVWAELN